MISGLIVYQKEDAHKNEAFISHCIAECQKHSVSLVYKSENEVRDYLNKNKIDFVIYRARNKELIEFIEKQGIKCFNNALTNITTNDKYLTYQFLKREKLPCLDSFLNIDEVPSYPIIMKSLSGHGGTSVFLINNKEEANRIINNSKDKYIYQEYDQNKGDLRVYVLNHQVVTSVLRNNKNDFRSNYSLGGEVKLYPASKEIKNIAIKISKALGATYIGVDFLLSEEGFVINEIEDPVGARMVYQTSDIDIIKLFIDEVIRQIK